MAFIKSISGFRGTIGGKAGDNLTPQDIVACAAAFGKWVVRTTGNHKVVIGRDGRVSGEIVSQLVCSTLRCVGVDVVDLGLSTTPTVEMAVVWEGAGGGIVLSASHNPKEWNALKLLNSKGEFISGDDGAEVLRNVDEGNVEYETIDKLGTYVQKSDAIARHIEEILALPFVDVEAVKAKKYKVVLDAINSTGAISVPPLLKKLGCTVTVINEEVNGLFAHNPEPLKAHLHQLSQEVLAKKAHFGIAVDPDVDRLVFMCEDGELFGEEYTLVAIAEYMLQLRPGDTVSNLSSTRALADLTTKYNQQYHAAAVGEVNVVRKMKEVNATIGGEGNGGVILPDLHYGRDALVGIALFLSHLALSGKQISRLKQNYSDYEMVKSKIETPVEMSFVEIKESLVQKYRNERINTEDGLRIDFENGWVHLRPSNTEPIIRIISESVSQIFAENYVKKIMADVQDVRNQMREQSLLGMRKK